MQNAPCDRTVEHLQPSSKRKNGSFFIPLFFFGVGYFCANFSLYIRHTDLFRSGAYF